MPREKKTMLESRLQKRIRVLHLDSLEQYCDYLFSEKGIQNELAHLYDVITTNKTEFFREQSHFDFLTRTVIPQLITREGIGIKQKLALWSAGCATGEEPYTLAIVLSELITQFPDFQFSIIASDISTKALEKAKLAVYHESQIGMIPENIKKKYFLRSKDKNQHLVRIIPGLRKMVDFRRINLMDEKFYLPQKMDIIFCRNVLIYFDKNTQEILIRKFTHCLKSGGYLFLGHAETLFGMTIPMVTVAPHIHKVYFK